MSLGRYRHRLSIQSNDATDSAYGDDVDDWNEVADWWGDIRPLKSTEVIEAQRHQGRITHRITMHYYPGLTTAHRIVFNGRTFNIDGVVNVDERNRTHEVMAVEDGA